MRPHLPGATVAVLVLAVAGCGSAPKPRAAAPTTPATVASPTASATPSPSVVASPTPTGPHKLGDPVPVVGVPNMDVTALAFRQPVAKGAPGPNGQEGYEWGAAEVRTCLHADPGGTVGVSEAPWLLRYADGSQAEPSNIKYQQFPLPQYPIDEQALPVGGCVRGWIVFPVPAGARPTMVEYAPKGYPTVDWAVS